MSKKQGFQDNGTDQYIYQELDAGTSVAIGMDDSDSDKLKIVTSATAGANPSGTAQVAIDPTAISLSPLVNIDNLRLDGNTLSSTDTNGDVIIAPDGTGVVSVTAAPIVPSTDRADSLGSATNSWDNVYADGITFDDGTNVLSAYDVGTFTPTLQFGGASTGITYSSQVGKYRKIGPLVFVFIYLALTNKGSSTGTASIVTLPFSSGSDIAPCSFRFSQLTYTNQVVARFSGTSVFFEQIPSASAPSLLNQSFFANNTFIQLAGCYSNT